MVHIDYHESDNVTCNRFVPYRRRFLWNLITKRTLYLYQPQLIVSNKRRQHEIVLTFRLGCPSLYQESMWLRCIWLKMCVILIILHCNLVEISTELHSVLFDGIIENSSPFQLQLRMLLQALLC